MSKKRLGDLLIQRGNLTQTQLEKALAFDSQEKGLLGEILLRLDFVKQSDLGDALSDQHGVPFVVLEDEDVDMQVPLLLPEAFSRKHTAVPYEVSENTLMVAMAWPDDLWTISEIELLTGYAVEPCVALTSDILRLLDRCFDSQITTRQTIVDVRMSQLRESGRIEDVQDESSDTIEASDAPVVRLVESIFQGGIASGASDIHFEPQLPEMRIRYRIDGALYDNMHIPDHIENALISRLKVMADLDITERRHPQDGHIAFNADGKSYDLRVSTMPTVSGEKMVVRILANDTDMFSIENLGFTEGQEETVNRFISQPYGMILVTGPTGSGKSTSLYAMISELNRSDTNIVTLEDPVENQLRGINQIGVDPNFGMAFASGLKYILRQDPDVIMVGEIRDGETAEVAVQASLTGHLLLSTLHTNDAAGAVARLLDLGVQPFLVASSLVGVVAQRLLRRVCDDCRKPYEPDPAVLEQFGALAERFQGQTLYRGEGCHNCFNTGYRGRCAAFELMAFSPALLELIEAGAKAAEIKACAIKEGMETLALAGVRRVVDGDTTIEEVRRCVLSWEDEAQASLIETNSTAAPEHTYAATTA